jgi:hypothetical protein
MRNAYPRGKIICDTGNKEQEPRISATWFEPVALKNGRLVCENDWVRSVRGSVIDGKNKVSK